MERNGSYKEMWEHQHGFVTADDIQFVRIEPERLQKIPIFNSVEDSVLVDLASRFTTEKIGVNQVIFNQGELGNKLYIVVWGKVDIVLTTESGIEQRLATLTDGDFFGEMALLEDAPRNASVRAVADTTLLTLAKEQFLNLLDQYPALRIAFVKVADARSKENRESGFS
jgi:ATP-binding cassette subfamily B protein